MATGPERGQPALVEQARRSLGLEPEEGVAEVRDEALGIIEREGRTGQMVAAVASNIVARVDAFQAAGSEREPGVSPEPIACRDGCPWCCYLHVDATAPEVFRIVEHIRGTFSAEEQTALRERVASLYEKSKGLDPVQRRLRQVPCALLVNRRCSIYPVRPALCRGYTAFDAEDRQFLLIDEEEESRGGRVDDWNVADIAWTGHRDAMNALGLDQPLELTEGLLVVLTEPDAMERWLRGEPIFSARRG